MKMMCALITRGHGAEMESVLNDALHTPHRHPTQGLHLARPSDKHDDVAVRSEDWALHGYCLCESGTGMAYWDLGYESELG